MGKEPEVVSTREEIDVEPAVKSTPGMLHAMLCGVTSGAKNAAGKLIVIEPPDITAVCGVKANVMVTLALAGARSASEMLKETENTNDNAGWSQTSSTCVVSPDTRTGSLQKVPGHAEESSMSILYPKQKSVPSMWRIQVCSRPATMAAKPLLMVLQVQVLLLQEVQVEGDVVRHTF
jgi:hypothetical protein